MSDYADTQRQLRNLQEQAKYLATNHKIAVKEAGGAALAAMFEDHRVAQLEATFGTPESVREDEERRLRDAVDKRRRNDLVLRYTIDSDSLSVAEKEELSALGGLMVATTADRVGGV